MSPSAPGALRTGTDGPGWGCAYLVPGAGSGATQVRSVSGTCNGRRTTERWVRAQSTRQRCVCLCCPRPPLGLLAQVGRVAPDVGLGSMQQLGDDLTGVPMGCGRDQGVDESGLAVDSAGQFHAEVPLPVECSPAAAAGSGWRWGPQSVGRPPPCPGAGGASGHTARRPEPAQYSLCHLPVGLTTPGAGGHGQASPWPGVRANARRAPRSLTAKCSLRPGDRRYADGDRLPAASRRCSGGRYSGHSSRSERRTAGSGRAPPGPETRITEQRGTLGTQI